MSVGREGESGARARAGSGSKSSREIRILLADDHQIVREGIRQLVRRRPKLKVVGEASDGEEALRMFRETQPDVAVLDVAMPRLNGIEATRILKGEFPRSQIVALSMHEDPHLVREMMSAGASAYLLKECAFSELAVAVQTVVSGGTYISPKLVKAMNGSVAEWAGREVQLSAPLTRREKEVLALMTTGLSVKDCAFELGLNVKTVETYRTDLGHKFGTSSVALWTKYALQHGISGVPGARTRKKPRKRKT
jgi:DNA-binding NarL/FixJ family response regulator